MGSALHRSQEKNYEMKDVYLGPSYTKQEIIQELEKQDITYRSLPQKKLVEKTSEMLAEGKVGALYQGRLEWGPRALGNRSILADPRRKEMRGIINQKVKFRENFRPFAPTVLQENAEEFFKIEKESPYMLFVHEVVEDKRDMIPAVTHVDGTSRIQTLKKKTNPYYYEIIESFKSKTGIPILLNTSLNLKGMPIANTPKDAVNCLQKSDMDFLVTEDIIIEKN